MAGPLIRSENTISTRFYNIKYRYKQAHIIRQCYQRKDFPNRFWKIKSNVICPFSEKARSFSWTDNNLQTWLEYTVEGIKRRSSMELITVNENILLFEILYQYFESAERFNSIYPDDSSHVWVSRDKLGLELSPLRESPIFASIGRRFYNRGYKIRYSEDNPRPIIYNWSRELTNIEITSITWNFARESSGPELKQKILDRFQNIRDSPEINQFWQLPPRTGLDRLRSDSETVAAFRTERLKRRQTTENKKVNYDKDEGLSEDKINDKDFDKDEINDKDLNKDEIDDKDLDKNKMGDKDLDKDFSGTANKSVQCYDLQDNSTNDSNIEVQSDTDLEADLLRPFKKQKITDKYNEAGSSKKAASGRKKTTSSKKKAISSRKEATSGRKKATSDKKRTGNIGEKALTSRKKVLNTRKEPSTGEKPSTEEEEEEASSRIDKKIVKK